MMKTILALAMFGAASAANMVSPRLAEWAMREHFAGFEVEFSKSYMTAEQREEKIWTFVQNMEEVVAKNDKLVANGKDAIHGITKFLDMSNEEFRSTMLNGGMAAGPVAANVTVATPTKEATPKSFDWRDSNVVTAVKDQGQCGSCWAHSAVESVESQFAINGGPLTSFSVQQVAACDLNNGDKGCDGGWYYTAWQKYMMDEGKGESGLTTEAAYPYDQLQYDPRTAGTTAECQTGIINNVAGTTPTAWQYSCKPCSSYLCNSQDEATLKANLVSHGPISIAVDASSFNSYTGGVVTKDSCSSKSTKLDHAIQLVGYNADGATPYWIVRNSWNTDWGLDGYIYLEYGKNTCGLANKAAQVSL